MKKRIFSRVLALVMALSLLSTTAFAASFSQLQDAINGGNGDTEANQLDGGYYGYAQREDQSYGITAKTNEDGSREVNIFEDVVYQDGNNTNDIKGIKTGENSNVVLNLNGNTIDGGYRGDEDGNIISKGSGQSVLQMGKDSRLEVNGGANADDTTERGTIQGGYAIKGDGGAIQADNTRFSKVANDNPNELILNHIDLTGNRADILGGAIMMRTTKATMTDTTISNNVSGGDGGGIAAVASRWNIGVGCDITMDRVVMENNTSGGDGGAIDLCSGKVTLKDSKVVNNTANGGFGGGAVYLFGSTDEGYLGLLKLEGNSEITGNKAVNGMGGGIVTDCQTSIISDDGKSVKISGNTAKALGDDIWLNGMSTLEGTFADSADADHHTTSGWYIDGYLGEKEVARWSEDTIGMKYTGGNSVALRFAHNKLYTVTLHPGYENAGDPVALPGEVGQDLPTVNDPTPRPGYEFAGWVIADENGNPTDEKFDPTAPNDNGDGIVLVATWTASSSDDNNDNSGSTDTTIPGADIPLGDLPTGGADAATTTIEDEETPLAGLFTRADAIGYLWEQTGSPEADLSDFEDVPEDHYWAVAIGWAQDMGIALPDEDGNFRPDDLVLRTSDEPEGELQEFLNRYAVFAGVELEDGELFIELDGEAEDFIMGEEAQVIFDEFFAKLEAALAAQAA